MRLSTTLLPLLLGSLPAAASGQSILEWPLLVEARPAPLVGGVAGVLGNPAGLADLELRAQGLVTDLETPEEMGLRALSIAGAVRITGHWTVALAYRHVGVGDMLRTDGPPLGHPPSFEIGEDVYALGAGSRFLGFLDAGAALRLDTPADDLGGEDRWTGMLGLAARPPLPLPWLDLTAGFTTTLAQERSALALAVEAGVRPIERLALALAYGAEDTGPLGWSHSVVAAGVWDGLLEIQAGLGAQPGSAQREWVPVMAALLHLGRYRLGAVREQLPNDFGAAMHYQLAVSF